MSSQNEDQALSTPSDSPVAMNNHYYHNQPRPPGYAYTTQYSYNHQHPPYAPMAAPYPATPYGMPTPYPNPYTPTTPPIYAPTVPYSQTRMAAPYVGYPPSQPHLPQYNYNTTTMIARPTRPASLYPQLGQMHTYPPLPTSSPMAVSPLSNSSGLLDNGQFKAEPTRNSVESNASRKSSEVSIGVSVKPTL